MKLKILIFGGSGFLGINLVNQLLEAGYKVFNFDLIDKCKLKHQDYSFIKGDINNIQDLKLAIVNKHYIFHYAGLSDLNAALDKPEESLLLNVLSTIKIMKFAYKYKAKQFIYASSIYATSDMGGFYKSSKLSAESYIKEFSKKYNLNYTIMRFGSVYGPGADLKNGVYKIISNAIKYKKVIYSGHKKTVRDFIHVKDCAKAAILCFKKKKYLNKIVLVAGDESIIIKDFLNKLKEFLNIRTNVEFKKNYEGHYIKSAYSKNEISNRVKLKSYINFYDGISEVIKEINEKK